MLSQTVKSEKPVLRTTGVSKRYPGVVALDNVDFDLSPGEVHVLFGENGAGKSTLISILSGAQKPDAGQLELMEETVDFGDVASARSRGVSAVFQEFSLAPTLTVAENLVLGDEPHTAGVINRQKIRSIARQRLDHFQFDIDPDAVVSTLSRAQQQMVEIAKAYRDELSVLILDEPTASLTSNEAERLFTLVRTLRERGIGIIYVTHRMTEIRELADRITVLRDGKLVATVSGSTGEDELIQLMTGRVAEKLYPELNEPGEDPILIAENLTARDGTVKDVSFTVKSGEIVGFAGLVGSGKSQAARLCYGAEVLSAGKVSVEGEDITGASITKTLSKGLVYLPSDRKNEGLFLQRPLRESITLPWLRSKQMANSLLLKLKGEQLEAQNMTDRLELAPANPDRLAEQFSGGNQQKALLGRALLGECQVYLLDEPSVGVDVGARVAIYREIVKLAERGAAVVIVSSDLSEILNLAHRVYVFSQGVVTAELSGNDINEELILRNMMHLDSAELSEVE